MNRWFRGMFVLGMGLAIVAPGCNTNEPPPKSFRENVDVTPSKTNKGKPVVKNKQVRGFTVPDAAE